MTLYATGLGVTTGNTPAATFYAWWSSSPISPPAPAATVPGFVSAFFEVKAPVPATGLNDGTVQRLTVALESFFLVDAHMNSIGLPSPADQVDVYVK